jgi:archaellum component FlaC
MINDLKDEIVKIWDFLNKLKGDFDNLLEKYKELENRMNEYDNTIKQFKNGFEKMHGELESMKSIEPPSSTGEIDRIFIFI